MGRPDNRRYGWQKSQPLPGISPLVTYSSTEVRCRSDVSDSMNWPSSVCSTSTSVSGERQVWVPPVTLLTSKPKMAVLTTPLNSFDTVGGNTGVRQGRVHPFK